MENNDLLTTIKDSFYDLTSRIVSYIPEIVVALLLVLIGFIVAKALSKLVSNSIGYIEKNKWTKKFFDSIDVTMVKVSDIAALFTKYAVLLIFLSAAVDVLGLEVLSNTFDSILAFVPKIFAAMVVAALSLVAGNVMKDLVTESAKRAKIKSANTLGSIARIVVLVFGFPLALAQLGLDLTVINNNITVVMAGIMLALGLAFGLGGRETASKIVENAYKNFKK